MKENHMISKQLETITDIIYANVRKQKTTTTLKSKKILLINVSFSQ